MISPSTSGWISTAASLRHPPSSRASLARPGLPALPARRLLLQDRGVVTQVIRHEGLDEVVAVGGPRLHPQLGLLGGLLAGRRELLRQEFLLQELIRGPLIDQDQPGIR